jgi:hypothetical protein
MHADLCLQVLKLVVTDLCPGSQRIKGVSEQICNNWRQIPIRRDIQGITNGWMLKKINIGLLYMSYQFNHPRFS